MQVDCSRDASNRKARYVIMPDHLHLFVAEGETLFILI